jgi:fructose-1,6-bisphosphatase/inositol monophosphatase family enzyme
MSTENTKQGPPAFVRAVSAFFSRLRRLIGNLLKFAQRDQLEELGDQTRRLGSATVESVTFVSGELRALDERLSRIEEELASLRRLMVEKQDEPEESESRPDRVTSGPPPG